MNPTERAEYLAETYADAILRLSYTYLKNTHDAQDVCQTVFVKLLTEPRNFESPAHERAYVLRMAANACKDLLKSPWRKRTCGLDDVLEVPAPEAADGSVLAAEARLADSPHRRCRGGGAGGGRRSHRGPENRRGVLFGYFRRQRGPDGGH